MTTKRCANPNCRRPFRRGKHESDRQFALRDYCLTACQRQANKDTGRKPSLIAQPTLGKTWEHFIRHYRPEPC